MEEHEFCRAVSADTAPRGSLCERCGMPAVFRLIATGGFAHNQSGVFCLKCGGIFVKMLTQIPEANTSRDMTSISPS